MLNPSRSAIFSSTLCLLGLMAWTAAPLSGQESTTRGLNLGFHLQGATLSIDDGKAEGGGGAGIRIGYGINRIVTLFFEADGVSVESDESDVFQGTWALGHGDLGVRFHFANSLRSWVPYLDVAVGGRFAGLKDFTVEDTEYPDAEISGGAFSFGGGIYFYFSQTFSMDIGVKFSGGEFTDVKVGNLTAGGFDIDASSTRFKVGVVWWP